MGEWQSQEKKEKKKIERRGRAMNEISFSLSLSGGLNRLTQMCLPVHVYYSSSGLCLKSPSALSRCYPGQPDFVDHVLGWCQFFKGSWLHDSYF